MGPAAAAGEGIQDLRPSPAYLFSTQSKVKPSRCLAGAGPRGHPCGAECDSPGAAAAAP